MLRKKPGRPVKGSMKPFLTETYKESLSVVLGRSEVYNDLYKYRTICKNYAVDRIRVTTKFLKLYKVLPLEQIEDYLRNSGYSNDYIHFIMCLYRDYSNPGECSYFVKEEECLKSADHHIAIQSSIQDVSKMMKSDVAKIAHKLTTITTMQAEDYTAIMNQYKLLQDTVTLFLNTFKTLYHCELPTRLKEDHYELILNLDPKLANYYCHDGVGYVVKTKCKKPIYRRLNNNAAVVLALIMATNGDRKYA